MVTKKNAIALAGIETIRDKAGHVQGLSQTFLNNVLTWKKDHAASFDVKVLDCRNLKDCKDPMGSLWEAIANAYGEAGIDCLFISGHSDWEGIYLFSKIRKELGEEERYITLNRDWGSLKFNAGSEIYLAGCQAGGRFGKKWPESIAQVISNSAQATVYAFASRSSQQKRPDGGFYQKPDIGSYIRFDPKVPLPQGDLPC